MWCSNLAQCRHTSHHNYVTNLSCNTMITWWICYRITNVNDSLLVYCLPLKSSGPPSSILQPYQCDFATVLVYFHWETDKTCFTDDVIKLDKTGLRLMAIVIAIRQSSEHKHTVNVCVCMYIYIYTHTHIYIYTGCPRRNGHNFGRVFLMLNYTDITQKTYIQSWMATEIMAREVWNFDSCYSLIDYQIHIETGRNMWFL